MNVSEIFSIPVIVGLCYGFVEILKKESVIK